MIDFMVEIQGYIIGALAIIGYTLCCIETNKNRKLNREG